MILLRRIIAPIRFLALTLAIALALSHVDAIASEPLLAQFVVPNGQPVSVNGTPVSGIAVNATGSPSVVTANGNPYLVSQTTSGTGTVNQVNPPPGNHGGRLTWIELH